ncbi:hypothetical protein [Mycobacterium sp.]|uniref:hypothetical protein n=1 Tax=Mycobacterium sp. TaxID=1785 RepID=UPI0031D0C449
MEGDAGASQLNPPGQAGTTTTAEALAKTSAEDVAEAAVDPHAQPDADGAGSAAVDEPADLGADSPDGEPVPVAGEQVAKRGPSRLGRLGVMGVCAVLVLLAAGVAASGYFALRSHHESQAIARDDAAAIAAAKECVAATQAPDATAVAEAQRKIIECSTGDFGAQAALYSGMLAQAYQVANVHVQVSDMRAAVERNNKDGSVDLLVALRVKVDNVEAQGQEYGYRLRVKMAREDGQYKIAKLDQVGK